MRVIGGEFRSRRLVAPHGMATRPTSDRLRETLFNVLGPRVAGARFADLYAGSGAVGIEALSRGAAFCLFVERAPAALAAIRANLAALKIVDRFQLESRSAARALEDAAASAGREPFDVVFLDPPYEAAAEYAAALGVLGEHHRALLAEGAVVVAEHGRKHVPPERLGALRHYRVLEQGDAALSFYRVLATADEG